MTHRTIVSSPSPWVPPPEFEEPFFSYFNRVQRMAGQPKKVPLMRAMFGPGHTREWDLFFEKPTAPEHMADALRPTGFQFDEGAFESHSLRALARPFRSHGSEQIPGNRPWSKSSCFLSERGMTQTRLKERPAFCLICTQQDIDNQGFGYWRRVHQVAGVRFCPAHGNGLVNQCNECGQANLIQKLPEIACTDCGNPYTPSRIFSDSNRDRVALQFGVAVERIFQRKIKGPLNTASALAHFRTFVPKNNPLPGFDLSDFVASVAGDDLMNELGVTYAMGEKFHWPTLFYSDEFVFAQASHQLLVFAALTFEHPNNELWLDQCPSESSHIVSDSVALGFRTLWSELKRRKTK